jgi:hypothetical protein
MGKRFQARRTAVGRPPVTVVIGDPGPGLLGRVDYDSRTITLAAGLLQRELRTTLTHELIHLERGPAPEGEQPKDEVAVERETARRLISVCELADAVTWTDDLDELALELWVDTAAVKARLLHLTDDERALIEVAWRSREGHT